MLLHISYTCLAEFVHHKQLQRWVGTYLPYLTQSVGKLFLQAKPILKADVRPWMEFLNAGRMGEKYPKSNTPKKWYLNSTLWSLLLRELSQ